jgi:hypothetical protein
LHDYDYLDFELNKILMNYLREIETYSGNGRMKDFMKES